MESASPCVDDRTCGLKRNVQLRARLKLPNLAIVMQALLVLANLGCDDWIKEWREERAANRKEEADKVKPDYIPPECRHPYGLYRVFSAVVFNSDRRAGLLAFGFKNDEVVWWGGTDFYGPDHKATRVRKQGGKKGCLFEYTEDKFVGTEWRGLSAGGPAKSGRPLVRYEGTWTWPVPEWRTNCVATGWEAFVKEAAP